MAKVETGHQKLLIKALKFRKTIIATVLILFAGAVSLYQEWVENLFHLWKKAILQWK
jgi:hypothetical protein